MNELTLGSLFDGSGGFPLGGILAGVTPVWASEIEPFPIRVTTKRLPFMKHYGDISALDGGKMEPVDIICFGSPCQDMSIAGKRSGLGGSRSNLFYEAVRIIKEMRAATNGQYPRWVCWENVPGAYSSNSGEDFRCVLESICRIADETISIPRCEKWASAGHILGDGFDVCWRTLDAQHWGVPQRRKRIYLVADLAGGCAEKVLFESEGLSGYSAEGFRSWQRTAGRSEAGSDAAGIGFDGYNGCLTGGTSATLGVNCGMSTGRNGVVLNDQGGNRMDITEDVTCTLRAEAHHPPCVMETICIENHGTDSRVKIGQDGKVQTLTSRMGTGGNNVPLVMKIRSGCPGGGKGPLIQEDKSATLACANDQTLFVPRAYGICSKDSNAMKSSNPNSGFYEAETSRTLDGNGGNPTCNQGGVAVVENCSAPVYSASKASFFTTAMEEVANTLVATDYKDPPLVNSEEGDAVYAVRRLTPTECARLQGFPDWWCDDLALEEITEEDIRFWSEVFETHRRIAGTASKPKTISQIEKWLRDPHKDSAEYKMWGNGVALPCVYFVLSGIVWSTQLSAE